MPCSMRRVGLPQLWLFAALAAASTPTPPDSAESCGSSDAAACPAASEADDAGLFQLRRSLAASERAAETAEKSESAAAKSAAAEKAALESITQGTPMPPLNGEGTINWWNLKYQRSAEQLANCTAQLKNRIGLGGAQFGYIHGKDGPRLAYECTKVPGLIEQVPEPMRGVFWTKGNVMNENLVVLQNGQWDPEARTLITPLAPFSWSWSATDGTMPAGAPLFNIFYRNQGYAQYTMVQLVTNHTAFSFKFQECPGARKLPYPFGLPGHACEKGSGNPPELTYAELAAHFWGMLENDNNNGQYTMEQFPNTGGESWLRGIYTKVFGLSYDLTSYNLVRILDGDGNPVEPYHSEYMNYIGDANLAFWYNYTDPEVMPMLKKERLREAWNLMWEGYCSQVPTPDYC